MPQRYYTSWTPTRIVPDATSSTGTIYTRPVWEATAVQYRPIGVRRAIAIQEIWKEYHASLREKQSKFKTPDWEV